MKINIHREFSERQKHQKQNGKWTNNVGESSERRTDARYFVQLAPESPLRKSSDVLYDDSSYDSFHNYETGKLFPYNLYRSSNGNFQSRMSRLSPCSYRRASRKVQAAVFHFKNKSGTMRNQKSCLNMQSAWNVIDSFLINAN